jgi:hypothetical protein
MDMLKDSMYPDRPEKVQYGDAHENEDEEERRKFEEDNFFRLAEDRKDKQARKRKEFEMHGGGDPFGDLGDFDSSLVTSLASSKGRGGDDGADELASLRKTKKAKKVAPSRTPAADFGGDDDDGDDGFGDDAAASQLYANAAKSQRERKKARADAHPMYDAFQHYYRLLTSLTCCTLLSI